MSKHISFPWSEIDKTNFAKFVIDTKNAPLTIEEEQEMTQHKFNEGMFLGVQFSRYMMRSIVNHHRDAVAAIFKTNGVLACAPKPVDGFCPVAIRAKLLPFMRQDKLAVKHEDRVIVISDDVIESMRVEVDTDGFVVRIGFVNSIDPIRKRAYHEFQINVAESPTKKEIDDQIISGFTEFTKNVLLFCDQDRLARYT